MTPQITWETGTLHTLYMLLFSYRFFFSSVVLWLNRNSAPTANITAEGYAYISKCADKWLISGSGSAYSIYDISLQHFEVTLESEKVFLSSFYFLFIVDTFIIEKSNRSLFWRNKWSCRNTQCFP